MTKQYILHLHYAGATKKKRPSASRTRQRSAGSILRWPNFGSLTMGLISGIVIAGVVFFLFTNSGKEVKISTTIVATQKTQHPQPAIQQKNNVEAPVEPRFDFYTELTKNGHETDHVVAKAPILDLKTPTKYLHKYLVQAGSFKHRSDADALKAQLTLNGLETKIEITKLDDGSVWHRVVLGPSQSASAAQEQKRLLKTLQVDAILVQKHADY